MVSEELSINACTASTRFGLDLCVYFTIIKHLLKSCLVIHTTSCLEVKAFPMKRPSGKENVMFSLKKRPKMKEEKRLLRKQMALLSEKSHFVGLDTRALYDLTAAMCDIMRVIQKG